MEFLNALDRRIPDKEFNKAFVTVKANVKDSYSENILKNLASAHVIIFVFPLYAYGLSRALMRLLEDYYQYIKTGKEHSKDTKVYVIVNSGFPRPERVTEEALRVQKRRHKNRICILRVFLPLILTIVP